MAGIHGKNITPTYLLRVRQNVARVVAVANRRFFRIPIKPRTLNAPLLGGTASQSVSGFLQEMAEPRVQYVLVRKL